MQSKRGMQHDRGLEGNGHANGITIRNHRTGGINKPSILLHGITDNGLCRSRVAHDLEGSYDIVMTDTWSRPLRHLSHSVFDLVAG